jgi:hypothetical protein
MNDLEWLRSRMLIGETVQEEIPRASRELKSGTVEATIRLDGTTMHVAGLMRNMSIDHGFVDATTFGSTRKTYLVGQPRMTLEIDLDRNGWTET